MTDTHKALSIKQTQALELTLLGLSDLEVAKRLKITRQTVNEWRNQNTAFMDELEQQRKLLCKQHMNNLNALMADAVGALGSALNSHSETTRLKAAALVLRVSGLQEQLKLSRLVLVQEDNPLELLSKAIGEVALEMGFREPGTPPPEPKQLADGKPPQE